MISVHDFSPHFVFLDNYLTPYAWVLLMYTVCTLTPLDAQFVLHGLEGCGFEL